MNESLVFLEYITEIDGPYLLLRITFLQLQEFVCMHELAIWFWASNEIEGIYRTFFTWLMPSLSRVLLFFFLASCIYCVDGDGIHHKLYPFQAMQIVAKQCETNA